jgi:hypothetical protein
MIFWNLKKTMGLDNLGCTMVKFMHHAVWGQLKWQWGLHEMLLLVVMKFYA